MHGNTNIKNESNIMGLQDNHMVQVLRTGIIVIHSPLLRSYRITFTQVTSQSEQACLILSPLDQSFIVHAAPSLTLVRDGLSCCSASLLAHAHIALSFIFNLFKQESQYGPEIFLFSKTYRPALGTTQPPMQWVPGTPTAA